MSLRHIFLGNFRSYRRSRVDFSNRRAVVITGRNGSGKTNLLEAISLLMPGRGLRSCAHADIGPSWVLRGCLDGPDGEIRIDSSFDRVKNRRTMRVNEQPLRRPAQISAHLHVSWLTPENTFWLSMAERRRFLDRCVMGVYPEHARHCALYERSMRERNRLLLLTKDNCWIAGVEEQMSRHAHTIVNCRQEFLSMMRSVNSEGACSSFPHPNLTVRENFDPPCFASLLGKNRQTDQAAGRTMHGPHAGQFMLHHPAKDIEGRLCSTGEQKILLLSLVLRYARLVTKKRGLGDSFLLLLDEVVAHLDAQHRDVLFEEVLNAPWQTFMTGTETSSFVGLCGSSAFMHLEGGQLLSRPMDECP